MVLTLKLIAVHLSAFYKQTKVYIVFIVSFKFWKYSSKMFGIISLIFSTNNYFVLNLFPFYWKMNNNGIVLYFLGKDNFEVDILCTEEQTKALEELQKQREHDISQVTTSAIASFKFLRWKDGIVPYQIDKSLGK